MMLRVRQISAPEECPWLEVLPGGVLSGLNEDTDYLLKTGRADVDVLVDDIVLQREAPCVFRWRPSFYAGRVVAEVALSGITSQHYYLDVSPSPAKSGQDEFDEMVAEINAFDQSLLSGTSSATMAFGREGRSGRYEFDVLLSRLRKYGPPFLAAVEGIASSPHRFLAADTKVLPLSRVRRLHHRSLQDRRLAAIATGVSLEPESIDSFQVNSLTSAPTFDTPANRTLKALLRRFRAAVALLEEAVRGFELGSPQEEQSARAGRRLHDLNAFERRTNQLLFGPLFREVTVAETSAAGLTQIAAQPNYSRTYRFGCHALTTQIEGSDSSDQLHVSPSWGIYETWCFLHVVRCTSVVTGCSSIELVPRAVAAERAVLFKLPDGETLEVLFQATFPSLCASPNRVGWSLSRERRPDIVLVHYGQKGARALVFDAKWRSGRNNVLEAMESAHIYHDALRIDGVRASPCILLLPGLTSVPELEQYEYVHAHGVGAISSVRPSSAGTSRVKEIIRDWLMG